MGFGNKYKGLHAGRFQKRQFKKYTEFYDFVSGAKGGNCLIPKKADLERLDMTGAEGEKGKYWRFRFKHGWNEAVGHQYTIEVWWMIPQPKNYNDRPDTTPKEVEFVVMIYSVKGKKNAVYLPLLKKKNFYQALKYFKDSLFPQNLELLETHKNFTKQYEFNGYNLDDDGEDDLEEDINKKLVNRKD